MPLTPEQIAQMDQIAGMGDNEDLFARMDAALAGDAPQSDNFFARVGRDLQERERMAQDIYAARPDQTKLEEVIQMAGKVGAGSIGDVAGQGLVSAGRGISAITPDPVKQRVAGVAQSVAQSPVGQFAGNVAGGAADIYGQFAQEHPRAARNIEGAANIALLGAPALRSGEKAIEAGTGLTKGLIGKAENALKQPMSAAEIREKGSELFQLADQQGGVLQPQFMDNFINEISKKTPQTSIGKAMQGESAVSKMLESLQDFRGTPLTLDAAREADEILGQLAYKNVDAFGKIDSTGKQFLDMQTTLRRMIDRADETMFVGGKQGFETVKEARKYWAAHLRMRDVERIIDNAQYFEQPATAIKTGFRTLLRNGDRLKGYSPAEVKAMKKAASTGIVGGALKLTGSGLMPIMVGSGGAVATGGAGAAAAIPAYLLQQTAKKGAEVLQTSKARAVTKQIGRRVSGSENEIAITPELLQLLQSSGYAAAPIGAVSAAQNQFDGLSMRDIMSLPPEQARKLLERSR